jgi:flagellar motor switch protein FliM
MLSQAEIDALLSGSIEIEKRDSEERINLAEVMEQSSSGNTSSTTKHKNQDKQIKPYNFWSPDRFSKEQMRAIEMIHEDLAERLTSSLPTYLRTNLRPKVVHTEQGRFHDFLQDLGPANLFHLITLAPLPGQIVVTIGPEISYTILELQLGGKSDRRVEGRSLTEIDQLLLRGMVEHMLNDIKAAWSKLVAVEPALDDTTVNYHWVQMVMGNERVMLITFEMTIQSVTGTMNIYIPFTTLKPIASVLNPYLWIAGKKERQPTPNEQQVVLDNLSNVTLPVQVLLGQTKLTFNELLNLQLGDVVHLNQSIHKELPVKIAHSTRFMALVGKSGNHLAAQITRPVESVDNSDIRKLIGKELASM